MDLLLFVILVGMGTPLWLPVLLWWVYGARARSARPVVQVGVTKVAEGSYRSAPVPVMAALGIPGWVTATVLGVWALAGALIPMVIFGLVYSAELALRVYMHNSGPNYQTRYLCGMGAFGVVGLVVSVGLVRAGASLLEGSRLGRERAHAMGGWLMVYQGVVALFGVAAYTGAAEHPSSQWMTLVVGYWASLIVCALVLCRAASADLTGRGLWSSSSR